MTTEFLAKLWQINQSSAGVSIKKLTTDTYRNRLTPQTASAGFIALHTAEAMHRFAHMLFGHEVRITFQATGNVTDDGKSLDLATMQQMVEEAYRMVADYIGQTTDSQWAEIIPTPFGEVPRSSVLAFLMHHNSYHAGQIVQAIKKGRVFDLDTAQTETNA